MNAAHLHLMVNHMPLFAVFFGGLLLAAGMLLKQKALVSAGLVLALIAAVGAFVAVETGEGAEEIVEEIPGVVRQNIHDHQEAGEAAMWTTVVLGLFAAAALAVPARMAGAKRAATIGSLVLALVAFAMVARAANLGGYIRHPEITSGSAVGGGGAGPEDGARGR